MQWLKLPAWKVRDRGFEPHSNLQISKKRNVSSLHTCKDSILQEASVSLRARHQTARTRISNLCLDGRAISFIAPSSRGSPGPVYAICAQKWPRTPFISFLFCGRDIWMTVIPRMSEGGGGVLCIVFSKPQYIVKGFLKLITVEMINFPCPEKSYKF